MITADTWYDATPDLRNYYQGDVLRNFPFPSLPTFQPAARQDVWGILRPRYNSKGRPVAEILRTLPNELIGRAAKDVVDVWTMPEGEHVLAACKKITVMIVSRSCDIDKHNRKHFLVAPVIAVNDLPEAQRTEEKRRDLRANDILHWFYLPRNANLPESFADLTQMLPLHRSFFDEETLRTSLLARLSSLGSVALQKLMSDFYGTKFGFVATDTCPQTARYACASCFFSGRQQYHSRTVTELELFGGCPLCGEDAVLWVKVPEER